MATEERAREVFRRNSHRLMRQPGVAGVGVERDSGGGFLIAIHLATHDPDVRAGLPDVIEGCPVRVDYSGPFRKLPSD